MRGGGGGEREETVTKIACALSQDVGMLSRFQCWRSKKGSTNLDRTENNLHLSIIRSSISLFLDLPLAL